MNRHKMENTKPGKRSKYYIGNLKLRVGRGVSGKGLFAVDEIPKDTCIIEYIGTDVPEAEQYKSRSKYLFETGKNKMINGYIPENTAKYINHSCRPNAEADVYHGHVYILSLRKIKPGEELTYDYGKEYFDEHIKPKGCLCVKCRKE